MLSTAVWAGPRSGDAGIKLRVTAEQANVREKPDIVSAILQQFPEGATLEAERKEGEWYAVLLEKEGGGFVLGGRGLRPVHRRADCGEEAPG